MTVSRDNLNVNNIDINLHVPLVKKKVDEDYYPFVTTIEEVHFELIDSICKEQFIRYEAMAKSVIDIGYSKFFFKTKEDQELINNIFIGKTK